MMSSHRNLEKDTQVSGIDHITIDFLYRAKIKGKEFMMKQELIDAAEASGLSRDAIGYCFEVNSCCHR